jgi:hypothetical protein
MNANHHNRRRTINTTPITVGQITITDTNQVDTIEGQTPGRVDATGTARRYKITGPGRLHLQVLDVTWDNGERDIRTVERNGSPQRFDRLCHGARLGILKAGPDLMVELRQARMTTADWSTCHKADLPALDAGAQTNTAKALRQAGAKHVGTRSEVLDDTSCRRNYLCAAFVAEATTVPIVAYTLTRVLPVLNKFPAY